MGEETQIQENTNRLFVYGTLMRGFPNWEHYLKNATFLSECNMVEGVMFHLGPFPAINLTDPRSVIHGEIFQVNPEELLGCDFLEGIPDHYQRVLLHIPPHGFVWTYVMPRNRAAKVMYWVPTGKWTGRDTPKEQWTGFRTDPIRSGSGFENVRPIEQCSQIQSISHPEFHYLVNLRSRIANGPWKFNGTGENGKPKVSFPKPRSILTTVRDVIVGPPKEPVLLPAPTVKIVAPKIESRLVGPGVKEV